jgi:GGDEF domain-containing protein
VTDVPRARVLLTGVGLIVLSLVALIMYVRSVDPIEVVGTLFFIPVFLGLMFWGLRGGVVLGIVAGAAYAALRSPAIAAVGAGRFVGLILGRGAGYLAFGAIGGWAADQLRASIDKLGLYDQIDDATGLLNARATLQVVDMERSRAHRYEKVFSVVLVEIPVSVFDRLRRRRHDTILKEFGRDLSAGIRGADRAGHALESDLHLIVVVLPETGNEGARAFGTTLRHKLDEWLSTRGIRAARVSASTLTYPDDGLDGLETRLRALAEFPS